MVGDDAGIMARAMVLAMINSAADAQRLWDETDDADRVRVVGRLTAIAAAAVNATAELLSVSPETVLTWQRSRASGDDDQ